MATNNCINNTVQGNIIGYSYTHSNTHFSTATTLNPNGGTPTTGNTSSLLSLNYTPSNVNNLLIFNGLFVNRNDVTGCGGTFFLFVGTTCVGAFASMGNIVGNGPSFQSTRLLFRRVAGTISSTTYSVRWSRTTGGTFYVNTDEMGRDYQGTINYFFSISEVLP